MEERIRQLESQVREITDFINSLGNVGTIPYELETALRARLGSLNLSAKTAASETQSVNEGGSAQYSVAKPPDGFKQAILDGQLVYIPFYT